MLYLVWCSERSHSKQNNIYLNNPQTCFMWRLWSEHERSGCIWSKLADTWMIEWQWIISDFESLSNSRHRISSFELHKLHYSSIHLIIEKQICRGFLWCPPYMVGLGLCLSIVSSDDLTWSKLSLSLSDLWSPSPDFTGFFLQFVTTGADIEAFDKT